MKAPAVALSVALAACSANSQSTPGDTAAGAALVAQSAAVPDGQPQTGLRQVPLTITSANAVHSFTVDVAATPEQQERGLMFVKSLAGDRGMIFPYDPPQPVAFWMRNTLIPLDIVFIRADGTIARITNAKALDETPLPSGEPNRRGARNRRRTRGRAGNFAGRPRGVGQLKRVPLCLLWVESGRCGMPSCLCSRDASSIAARQRSGWTIEVS